MILKWQVHVIIYLSRSTEYTTPSVNTDVSYGLWMIRMCPYSFIICNKYTTLMGGVDNGGGSACVGAVGIWEISIPSSQFCCEHKTALKNCLFKRNRISRRPCTQFVCLPVSFLQIFQLREGASELSAHNSNSSTQIISNTQITQSLLSTRKSTK